MNPIKTFMKPIKTPHKHSWCRPTTGDESRNGGTWTKSQERGDLGKIFDNLPCKSPNFMPFLKKYSQNFQVGSAGGGSPGPVDPPLNPPLN